MNASVEQRARTGEPSAGILGGGLAGFTAGAQWVPGSPALGNVRELAIPCPAANRTPNLARRLENLAALDFQCCERPLGSTRLPPPLLREPARVRGSARRYMVEEKP